MTLPLYPGPFLLSPSNMFNGPPPQRIRSSKISFITIWGAAVNKTQEMYLGTLFSMEDLAVYGYMTNTKIKFITVLNMPDVTIKDLDMKNVKKK